MNSDLSSTGLSKQTISKICDLFERVGSVSLVLLYGSRATGRYRNGSDIDLVIKESELTTTDLIQIEQQLDDLLLPYTFDLSIFEAISNPNLIHHIETHGVVFYQRAAGQGEK